MPMANQTLREPSQNTWKDIVDDYLEMGCSLGGPERKLLIEKLNSQGVLADSITKHFAFSVAGRLVVLVRGNDTIECWFYNPKTRRVDKYRLKKSR